MAAILGDDVFKCFFFLNENEWISILSLKLVNKGPINNIPALLHKMAWHRSGDKPVSGPMMFNNAHMRLLASMC